MTVASAEEVKAERGVLRCKLILHTAESCVGVIARREYQSRQRPQPLNTSKGAVQMLGGRRRGGTKALAGICHAGRISVLATMRWRRPLSERGAAICWMHLTKHMLMSWHRFWGQSGHCFLSGFAGLWNGMESASFSIACELEAMPMARATELDTGTLMISTSMASMPRHRWQRRMVTSKKSCSNQLSVPLALLAPSEQSLMNF